MTAAPSLCEKCQTPGTYLTGISRESLVDYFRCPTCAHVWTQPKTPRPSIDWTKPPAEPT